MADALTTILRRAGEVTDPALLTCELAQAFARVILCLRSLKRKKPQVLAVSTSDPAHAERSTTASERWAELSARLEFIGELGVTPGHPTGMLINAVWMMWTWLCPRAGRSKNVRGDLLFAENVRLMLQGEDRLARQTALLVRETLDLFEGIPRHERVTSDGWISRQKHQRARPPMDQAGGKAHMGATLAKARRRSTRNMWARSLWSSIRSTMAA